MKITKPHRRSFEIRFASDDALSPLIWRLQRRERDAELVCQIQAQLSHRARRWGSRHGVSAAHLEEFASGILPWLLLDRRDEIARWDPRINARFWAYLVRCFALHRYRADFLARYVPQSSHIVRELPSSAPTPGWSRWVALAERGDRVLRIAGQRGDGHLATFTLAHFDWFGDYAARLRNEGALDGRFARIEQVERAIAEQTRRPYEALARELTEQLVDRGDRRIKTLPGALVGQLLGITRAAVNVRVHRVRRDLQRALTDPETAH